VAAGAHARAGSDVIPTSGLARTTGVSFINALAFVQERFPPDSMERVLGRLPRADRQFLTSVIQPKQWYGLASYVRLIRAIDAALGSGDLSLMPVLGRFEAERDRSFAKDLFLRMASPNWAVRMVADYWALFHDTGRWSVRREGALLLHGVLEDFGLVDEALCAELTGYVSRVMEFAGGQSARMIHPECRARGAAACHFLLTWEG
jgi:hypothetical protein